MTIDLRPGDCLAVMRAMAAEGIMVDSIVTDPPYHLTSIVKRFGSEGAAPAQFGTDGAFARASRGFMGKVWDGGDVAFRVETWRAAFDALKPGGHMFAFGGTRTYHRMACAIEDAGFEIRDQFAWMYSKGFPKSHDVSKALDKMAYIGPARQWQGWGSAAKPAWEPICLARKPLAEKTIAANVLKWGTGALNIDGCRVSTEGEAIVPNVRDPRSNNDGWVRPWMDDQEKVASGQLAAYERMKLNGRWPANVVHDGSEEVVGMFPSNKSSSSNGQAGRLREIDDSKPDVGKFRMSAGTGHGDSGSCARFFYSAKAGEDDRADSKHPTVKPVALMRWLVRMVTPPGGTVLDLFAGSGTTGVAAIREGFNAILIEAEPEYQADIRRRIAKLSGLDGQLYAR